MSRRCPICTQPVTDQTPHRPFCSPRCQDVDLGRWLGEEYRISRPLEVDDLEQARAAAAFRRPDLGNEPN